ncbi:hypothetical protein ACFL1H_06290, partial [Nanoarchaeota archaeon]
MKKIILILMLCLMLTFVCAEDISLTIEGKDPANGVDIVAGGQMDAKLKIAPTVVIEYLDITSESGVIEQMLLEKMNLLDGLEYSATEQILEDMVDLPGTLPAGEWRVDITAHYYRNDEYRTQDFIARLNIASTGVGSDALGIVTKALPGDAALEILNHAEPKKIERLEKTVIASDLDSLGLGMNDVNPTPIKTIAAKEVVLEELDGLLAKAKSAKAKSAITEMMEKKAMPIISESLNVYELKDGSGYINKVVISVDSKGGMNSLEIALDIPKSVANDVDELSFSERPIILDKDPIVKWNFNNLPPEETKDYSYTVETDEPLEEVPSTTYAAGNNPSLFAKFVRFNLKGGWILSLIIVLVILFFIIFGIVKGIKALF